MNPTIEAVEGLQIKRKSDEAILLVTFGSTYDGPHQTFATLRAAFREAFPDRDLFMAFTSRICIKRWAKKSGEQYYTPDVWLEAMGKAGYKRIVIQSLHVIPGLEYSLLAHKYIPQFIEAYPGISVSLGRPLLWSDRDRDTVGDALLTVFKDRLDRGETVVLMGHGNNTDAYPDANQRYDALNDYLQSHNPRIVIGTVDYQTMLFDFVSDYLNSHVGRGAVVNLAPLMSVAGDHAQNDLAGDYDPEESDEEQSWMVRLQKLGYQIDKEENCHLVGLADYEPIRKIWIEHMQQAKEITL